MLSRYSPYTINISLFNKHRIRSTFYASLSLMKHFLLINGRYLPQYVVRML